MFIPRFEWRVFLVALVATVLCVSTFWLLVPPTYLTNDDVTTRLDLDGLTTPVAMPTGYTIMPNSALSWTLVAVQKVMAVHAWDALLAILILCAVAVALTLAWQSAPAEGAHRIAAVAALVAVWAPLFGGVQFTISGTLAGGVGMALTAVEVIGKRPRLPVLILAVALMLLGTLVRPMGATAAALLMSAMLLPLSLIDPAHGRRRFLLITALGAGAGIGLLALLQLDQAIFRLAPDWNAYLQYNWKVARLFEWGGDVPSNVVAAMRAKVGWSANDWELLRRWWGVDPDLHSIARVDTIYRAWSEQNDWKNQLRSLAARSATTVTPATFVRLVGESAIPLAVGAIMLIVRVQRRALAAVGALVIIFFCACIAIEVGFKELPFRLFGPLQACLILAVLLTTARNAGRGARWVPALGAVLLVGLSAREARAVAAEASANYAQAQATERQVAELLELKPSLIILHADAFPSELWWRPFHTPPLRLPAVGIGMNNQNPNLQRFLSTGFPQPFLRTICTDPTILVVSEENRLQPVTEYMREHHGIEVRWEQVYSGSFRVWRCTPVK